MNIENPDLLILVTGRLTLRRFTLDDAGFALALLNSPGWLQYIGDRGIKTMEDAQRYLQEGPMTAFRQYGYGFSAVCLKSTGEAIGGCGLIRRAGLNHADIGFALLPEFTGKGYGEEIAAATLHHASQELGIRRILGITLPENTRSIRLLEKLGMRFEKRIRLPADQEELMLFGVEFRPAT